MRSAPPGGSFHSGIVVSSGQWIWAGHNLHSQRLRIALIFRSTKSLMLYSFLPSCPNFARVSSYISPVHVGKSLYYCFCGVLGVPRSNFMCSIHTFYSVLSISITFTMRKLYRFPLWFRWQRVCLQCGRPAFNPRVKKIPSRGLQKGMATHSSVLAWRIPWTEEPGRLQSKGHKELDMTEQLTLKIIFMRAGILSYFRRL